MSLHSRTHKLAVVAASFCSGVLAAWFVALAWVAHAPLTALLATVGLGGVLLATRRSASPPLRSLALVGVPALALVTLYRFTPARNDRNWAPDVARAPWAEVQGDLVTIHNFRNFDWHSETEADERWEDRTVHLSNLRGVDLAMVHWGGRHLCHTQLSFDFGPDGVIAASVEARREAGETYSPFRGLFRHYELLYVLGDERDVLRLRTNYRRNEVLLFRLQADQPSTQALFLDYVARIDELRDRPDWYHSITTNCTTVIRGHEQKLGVGVPWDWRIFANGHVDSYLYDHGYIDTTLPLSELRQRAAISERARHASVEDYSATIRSGR